MNKMVEIASLVTEGIQTRDGLAKAVVKDYAEALKAGTKFPPVTVVQDNVTGQLYLVDGYHRKDAAILAGLAMIEAEVTEGSFTDAVRLAIKANAAHGLRRTKADKKNAIRLALVHAQELFGANPSNDMLADACAVTKRWVKKIRPKLTGGEQFPPCDKRIGKDGKLYSLPKTPAVSSEVTDRYGAAIPEKIVRAFGSKELETIVTGLRRLKASIEEKIAAEDFAYCKVSQSTLISLGNVIADLRLETPWCVCRQCGGRGCHACGNTGVQTKLEYERNPKELRPDA